MRVSFSALALAVALVASLGVPRAVAHVAHDGVDERTALVNGVCEGGDPITPTQVIEGSFPHELQGSYVMVPFVVPPGTTQLRVKYCWDRPEGDVSVGHTIDLGLWEPRPPGGTWGVEQFRGWGGSSHPDVTLTPQGFSTEEEYLEDPKGHVPGRTTRGFLPGPIPPGEWAAELGVAAVVSAEEGDADGRVRWRLEIELSSNPEFAAEPYRPALYDRAPARRGPDWFAGDMHVHAEHSALGDATMREVFDYAFRPLAEGGAGLDFITLSDYVTPSAWGEIGRYQDDYPGKLVIRSSEIITYTGHTNNHASLTYVDHRTGPVYEWLGDDEVELLRPARPARDLFRVVRQHRGWTQINHPTIFPSSDPTLRRFCRGCPWDFTVAQTDFSLVDAIEIQTGPAAFGDAPNPFTLTAIEFWEAALDRGHKIAAVGSSDSHHAGRTRDVTQTPIGRPTTVVYARHLSEQGIRDGVRAGHTYVKLLGNDGPDLRFEARATGGNRAIMGDTLYARSAELTARVFNLPEDAPPHTLYLVRNGKVVESFPVDAPDVTFTVRATGPARYRLQLQRGEVIVAVTSPIWLESPGATEPTRLPKLGR
ncbi:MAG TPA: CehA/McbA family metallohydrolase [Candidatus Binatia bacterium]